MRTRAEVAEPIEMTTARESVAAFSSFYEQTAPVVFKALCATLGNSDLARDATQEAMTRAWLRWAQVSRTRNPPGWVYRVGLNWARSRFRKLRRDVMGVAVDREREPAASDMPDLDVASALRVLPQEHRAVLVLRFYMDWTVEDVADVLGVPAGTVKSRQHWALKRLREELGDDR